jgi:hypothetical protein
MFSEEGTSSIQAGSKDWHALLFWIFFLQIVSMLNFVCNELQEKG